MHKLITLLLALLMVAVNTLAAVKKAEPAWPRNSPAVRRKQ